MLALADGDWKHRDGNHAAAPSPALLSVPSRCDARFAGLSGELHGASLLQGLGIFALAQVQQMWHIVPFLLAYAPGYGGLLALKPAIVGEYYGRKNFGTIYGVIQGISTAGGIAGPVFAGWVYDCALAIYVVASATGRIAIYDGAPQH